MLWVNAVSVTSIHPQHVTPAIWMRGSVSITDNFRLRFWLLNSFLWHRWRGVKDQKVDEGVCVRWCMDGSEHALGIMTRWWSTCHWDYWNMDQHTTLLIRSACPIWPDAWHSHGALVTMTMPCIMAYAIILLLHKQASSCHHCLHPLQQVYLLINEQWRHGSSIIISANQDMPDHPDNCHHCCWPLGCFTLHTFSKLISSLNFSHS